jgi:hypothetical protein
MWLVCACSLSLDTAQDKPVYTGIDLSSLSSYQTSYFVEFKGEYTWRYSLITHHNGVLTEKSLHIEGVSPAQNPGDIRLVTDGQTSWMTGPGVDDECYLFPDDFDIGYTFLTPDNTFPPEKIAPLLVFESEGQEGGLPTKVFFANVPEHDGWRNLNIVMWLVERGNYPIYYDIRAEGNDPLFDAGEGSFSGTFTVGEDPNYLIEPVTGCEIPFSLPEGAEQVVRFPGLYSFESGDTLENLAIFYHNYLTTNGWKEDQPLTATDTGFQMNYTRGDEVIVFYFETIDDGVFVEVLQQ